MISDREQSFILAIVESPDDTVLRAIYADWLEDNDRIEEASNIRTVIPTELASSDWGEAFKYAEKPHRVLFASSDWGEAFKYAEKPHRVLFGVDDVKVSEASFTRSSVKRVIASVEGINDEADWVCIGELLDGRFFLLKAGCDYTGWGCREGGSSAVAETLEDIVRLGLTDDDRKRLNLTLPE